MSMTPFKKLNLKDQDLVAVQENVGRALDPIITNPLLDGILLQNIVIPPSGVMIPHKLGRNWRGYILTKAQIGSIGYSVETDDSIAYDHSKFLYLTQFGISDLTADIWVF